MSYLTLVNCISDVMVSVLASSAVDHGFIGDVMVSVLASSSVDHRFIGGVMVSVLASSAVDHRFELRSGQTKDYKIGICCFSARHAALKRKSKDWLAWNQNNVSEWSDMSTRELLFQWASTIKSNSACWPRIKRTSTSSHWKLTCSRHDIAEKLMSWL